MLSLSLIFLVWSVNQNTWIGTRKKDVSSGQVIDIMALD